MSDLVGSEWHSKDGLRTVVVIAEAPRLRVRGVRGSSREWEISYNTLLRNYEQAEDGETE